MTGQSLDFAVVYLCRKPNPVWKSRAFLNSFFANDPGVSPQLYFLHKGYDTGTLADAVCELSPEQQARIKFLWIDDNGQAERAYHFACQQITDVSHVLIFNSNAIIEVPNWATLYRDALLKTNGRALIGATGSWEALPPLGVTFPNPHIRTTAVMVSRERFIRAYGHERINKRDSYLMESGPESLTNAYLKNGDPVYVLGRDGRLYPPDDWPQSHTFRAGRQENLVIGDLKTSRFKYLGKRKRLAQSELAWGDQKSATGGFFMSWLPYRIWYKNLYSGYRFRWLMRLTGRG